MTTNNDEIVNDLRKRLDALTRSVFKMQLIIAGLAVVALGGIWQTVWPRPIVIAAGGSRVRLDAHGLEIEDGSAKMSISAGRIASRNKEDGLLARGTLLVPGSITLGFAEAPPLELQATQRGGKISVRGIHEDLEGQFVSDSSVIVSADGDQIEARIANAAGGRRQKLTEPLR